MKIEDVRTIDWSLVPERMRHGLRLYFEQGVPPGHFLSAVLSNDLREAVARADEDNQQRLPDYIKFLYNNAPNTSWGSREKFESWCKNGGMRLHAIYLVYPEEGWMSNDQIETWYFDAVANSRVPLRDRAKTIAEMVEALEDAGIITTGRPH